MENLENLEALDRLYEYIQVRDRGVTEKDLVMQADPNHLKDYLDRLVEDKFIYKKDLFVRGAEVPFYYANNSFPFESYLEKHKYEKDLKHLQRKKALYEAGNAELTYKNFKSTRTIAIIGCICGAVALILVLIKQFIEWFN